MTDLHNVTVDQQINLAQELRCTYIVASIVLLRYLYG